MAPLLRTQNRRSTSCWTLCRTSRGSSIGWTTTRRASRRTCSTSQAFSSALHVRRNHPYPLLKKSIHLGTRKTKGSTPTSGDTLLCRRAIHQIRDMPRFRSYSRSSPRTHYTGRWATTSRYELRHLLPYIDLIHFVSPSSLLSVGTFFFYKKKRVHAPSAKHTIVSAGDRRPGCRWWTYDWRVRGMVGGVLTEQGRIKFSPAFHVHGEGLKVN
jgi:hypothetical protein